MAHYTAELNWQRKEADFLNKRYSRAHTLRFDGGIELPGSSSVHIVPLPYSVEAAVDPEELFVAALASCHLLWFLDLAAQAWLCIDHYQDAASGKLGKNAQGQVAMTEVTLRPKLLLAASTPASDEHIIALHHQAHELCFLANSVKSTVLVEPHFD
jgi:organic hydroperoxide reductase OsmC/OhrA